MYEALHGQRPFGADIASLMVDGGLPELPRNSRVPGWLHAVSASSAKAVEVTLEQDLARVLVTRAPAVEEVEVAFHESWIITNPGARATTCTVSPPRPSA